MQMWLFHARHCSCEAVRDALNLESECRARQSNRQLKRSGCSRGFTTEEISNALQSSHCSALMNSPAQSAGLRPLTQSLVLLPKGLTRDPKEPHKLCVLPTTSTRAPRRTRLCSPYLTRDRAV